MQNIDLLVAEHTPPRVGDPTVPTKSRVLPLDSRLFGVAGLAGALLLGGDLLLYLHWGPAPPVSAFVSDLLQARRTILLADRTHLIATSVIAPIAAALYVAGSVHLYERLRRGSERWAIAAALLFSVLSIGCGAYRTQFGLWMVVQFVSGHPGASELLLLDIRSLLSAFYTLHFGLAMSVMAIMLGMVASGRSSYPRWTAAFNPILIGL